MPLMPNGNYQSYDALRQRVRMAETIIRAAKERDQMHNPAVAEAEAEIAYCKPILRGEVEVMQ